MAVYSAITVCNMALDRIGISTPISDLSDTDDRSTICNRWYAISRDTVLAGFKWPFAKKRATLGLVEEFTDDGDPDLEWTYSYRYPNNCVEVYRIVSGSRPESKGVAFELGQDDTGRLIFTDQEDAIIEGTFTYDDPGEWPDLFAQAVSAELAEKIAMPLRQDPQVKAEAAQARREAIILAQAHAMAEGYRTEQPVSKYIAARGVSVDPFGPARFGP